MRRGGVLAVALALVVGALAAGFFLAYERVETAVHSGPGPLARRDPHLALARLLAALGTEVVRARAAVPPPTTTTPLLLLVPPGTVGEAQIDALAAWVSSGGLLVTTPQPSLLARFQVRDSGEGAAGPVEVQLPPARRTLRVWMPASPRLVSAADEGSLLAPNQGALVERRHGAGTVVLLASDRFARNDRIGELDHAAFLCSVLGWHDGALEAPVAVTLVAYDTPPTLVALLARHGWAPALALLATIAAWTLRAARRVGPVLQAAPPPRRSLLEHVRASGDLLWRQREVAALLRGPREAVTRRAAQRHPGWRTLPQRQRIQRLADAARVPGGLLAQALDGAPPQDEAGLRRAVALLSQVWRSM